MEKVRKEEEKIHKEQKAQNKTIRPKKKPRRLSRWVAPFSLVFLIFCLVLFLILLLVIPSQRFSSWLLARVNQRLEQSYFLKIEAERLKLNPWQASLEATRLKVWFRRAQNYPFSEKSPEELSPEVSLSPLFEVEKMAINLAIMPLFRRQLHFQAIYFDSPRFNLISPGIWKLPARASPPGDKIKKERKKEGSWQFRVDRFQLEKGALDLSLDQKIKNLTLEEIQGEIKSGEKAAKYYGRISLGKGKAFLFRQPEISLAPSSFDFELSESEVLINSFIFQADGLILSGDGQINFKPQPFLRRARVTGKINLEEIPWRESLKTGWPKAGTSFISGSFPSGKINFSLEAAGEENILKGEAKIEGKGLSFYFPLAPLQGSLNFKLPLIRGRPEVSNFMADFYLSLKETGQIQRELPSRASFFNFFEGKAITYSAQKYSSPKSFSRESGQSEGGKDGTEVLRSAPVLSGELKGKIKGKEIELNRLSLDLAGLNFSSSGKLEASKKFQAEFELRAGDLARTFTQLKAYLKPYFLKDSGQNQFLKEIMAEEKEDLISGKLALKGTLGGLWPEIGGRIHLELREFQGPFWPAAQLEAEAELKERRINLSRLELFLPATEFSASGFMPWPLRRDDGGEREKLDFLFRLKIDDLGKLAQTEKLANFVQKKFIQKKDGGPVFLGGSLFLEASLKGNLKGPLLSFKIQGKDLASEIENLAFFEAEGKLSQSLLTSQYQLKKTSPSLPVTGKLTLDLKEKLLEATLTARSQNLADFSWLQSRFPLQGQADFQLEIRGKKANYEYFYKFDGNNIESPYFSIPGLTVSGRGLLRAEKLEEASLRVNFDPPSFSLYSFPLQATGPFEFSLRSGFLSISGFSLKGENFNFQVEGTLGLEKMAGELNLEAKLPLKLIADFLEPAERESLAAQGELVIKGKIGGSFRQLQPDITFSMSDGLFASPFMRFPAEKINLLARLRPNVFELEKLSFQLGPSRVSAQARLPVEISLNETKRNETERTGIDGPNELNSGKEKKFIGKENSDKNNSKENEYKENEIGQLLVKKQWIKANEEGRKIEEENKKMEEGGEAGTKGKEKEKYKNIKANEEERGKEKVRGKEVEMEKAKERGRVEAGEKEQRERKENQQEERQKDKDREKEKENGNENEKDKDKGKRNEEAEGERGEFSLSFSPINPLDFLGPFVTRLPAEIREKIESKEISAEIGGEIKLSLAPLRIPLPGPPQSLNPGQGQIFWPDKVQGLSPDKATASQKANLNGNNKANFNNNVADSVSILPRNLSQGGDESNKRYLKVNNGNSGEAVFKNPGKIIFKKDWRAKNQGQIQNSFNLNPPGVEFSGQEEDRFSAFKKEWLASLKGEGSLNPVKINLGEISLSNEKPIIFRFEPDLLTLEEATLKGESFQIIFGGEIKNPLSLKSEIKAEGGKGFENWAEDQWGIVNQKEFEAESSIRFEKKIRAKREIDSGREAEARREILAGGSAVESRTEAINRTDDRGWTKARGRTDAESGTEDERRKEAEKRIDVLNIIDALRGRADQSAPDGVKETLNQHSDLNQNSFLKQKTGLNRGSQEVSKASQVNFYVQAAGSLEPLSDWLEGIDLRGKVALNFHFSGSPSSLKPHGSIELREISLELLDWPLRLSNSTGYFFFDGRRLEIRSLRGLVNGTPWEIAGFFGLDERGQIDSGFLQLEAREIPLEMEGLGGSLVSLGLRLEPRKPGWLLHGDVRLKKTSITAEIGQISRFSRRRTMLPARAGRRPLPSGLENLALQVGLNLEEPVVISNSFLQASLAGALTLTGNLSQPVLLGRLINSGPGEFIWAERRYRLEKMEVDFPGLYPLEPRLEIVARTELVHRYDELSVRLSLSGPVSELRFSLQSTPPRSQEELAFLLLTGKSLEEIRTQGIGALREQLLLALMTPTASRLGGAMRRLFGVEEARIEPLGIAGETDPGARLTLVKEVTPAARITSSIDITNSQRQSWVLDYRLTRSLLFQGFRLDDGSYGAGLRHSFSLGGGKIAGIVSGERKKEEAEEKRVIASVRIEGNPVFPEAEIRKKISRLRPGRPFTSTLLDREIKSLESFYRKNKYLQARIEPQMEIRDKRRVEIVLAIQAGPRIELNFEGASISKSLRWRAERIWAREIAPERAAARVARLIENYLKGRGYFRAEVTYDLIESGLKGTAFHEMNKVGRGSGENGGKRSSAETKDVFASEIKPLEAGIYSWQKAKTELGIRHEIESGEKAGISPGDNGETESGQNSGQNSEIDSRKKAPMPSGDKSLIKNKEGAKVKSSKKSPIESVENTGIEAGEKTEIKFEERVGPSFGEKSERQSWKKPEIDSGERAGVESAVNKKEEWNERMKEEMNEKCNDKNNLEVKEEVTGGKIDDEFNKKINEKTKEKIKNNNEKTNKVNEIMVNFKIRPGELYRVEKIEIEGVGEVRKQELLRAIKGWRTDEAKGPVLFVVEPRAVLEAIRRFYEERGYLEARASAEIREDEKKKELYVYLKVDEGRLSRVAEIKMEGSRAIAPSLLESVIGSRTGRPFNPDQVSADRQNLLAFYRARGFREATVSARVEMIEGGPDVRLIFQIEEGCLHEVSSVEFRGMEESRKQKLAEIFGLKRGEALTLEKISQGQKALYDTGDFSLVQVMTEPEAGEPGKQRVRVEVRPEPALNVRSGLRYNSENKTEVVAGLDFRHFLGVGRHGLINYLQNERERDFRFSFHDRSFLGLKVESLLSFYLTRRKEASFTTDEAGASWRHQLTLPGRVVLSTVLRRSRIHTYEVEPSGPFPFDISLNLTELSLQAVRDTRDDPLDARRGSFFSSSLTYSPEALKSELTYLSWFGQASFYQPVGERVVLASNFRLGLATAFDQVMVPARRFYAGGSYSLRGFRQDRVGPYDPYLERPEGGESVFIFNQELRYRLFPGLDGVLFYDAGNVFPEVKDVNWAQLRHSLGLGLRLRSPVGLLRFDLGFNLKPRPGEPRQVFFFSLGQIF